MANKLNDYLMEQTILQKREWIENMAEYGMNGLNDPEFSDEKAFEATVDWVCLLYTSPSPRDKRQSRMPSSA